HLFPSSYPVATPVLHSFPTRRSSDLVPCRANVQTPAAHQLSANQTAVTDSRADRAFDWYMLRWRAIECGDYENAARAKHVPIKGDRKSTRLNSSHGSTSYAVFCLKKK